MRAFILVSFWNCKELLEPCLESLQQQSVETTVVLIDDCSDQPAHRVGKEWCRRGRNRVLIRTAINRGPAYARHVGIEWILSSSTNPEDVIVLVDGDDRLSHPKAIERLADVYRRSPEVQMTLGNHRRSSGRPTYRSRYQEWQFEKRKLRTTQWCGRHPRSFRVGLIRRVRSDLRCQWPNGTWLRGSADVALLMPLLEAIDWCQLRQLEETLYVYNDARADGATTAFVKRSSGGRLRHILEEGYARSSATWTVAKLGRVVREKVRSEYSKRAVKPTEC